MGIIRKKCPNCLAEFDACGRQTFCSLSCKDSYGHRARRRLSQAKDDSEYHRMYQQFFKYHKPIDGYPETNCPGCGVLFKPITSKQMYCCKMCGDRVRRKDPARIAKYKKNQIKYNGSSARHFISRLLNKKSRNRHLDIDYVMGIYDAQEGFCALSGIKMTHISGEGRVPTNISIDRIDSNLGYIEGNIQLVCCAVNLAKSSWTEEEFIDICRKIVDKADSNQRKNSNPTDNSSGNLRVISRRTNRSKKENSRRRGSRRSRSSWGV